MATVISVLNQKGGTGKTTTSVNLSAYLVALGKKVLLVDIDPQANATSGLGVDRKTLKENLYHALVLDVSPGGVIRKTRLLNLDILPGSPDLAGASVELVGMKRREFRLRDLLKKVSGGYDYIIIDPPPSLGLLTLNSITASDKVIIPVQCEYYAMEGLAELLRTIQLVKKNLKSKIEVGGVVLTMFDKTSRLHRAVAKEIRKKFPGHVFETVVPRNISLAEAPSFGKAILQYDPYSHGAKAYRQLAQELIQMK
ncbi:MAG: AAA family ATPase [bacterium]|nr:AAA family ATPase [bacterium]